MTSTLKSLLHNGLISTLSYFFARFIAEQSKQPEENLLVQTAALVSERGQQGDVCVDLNRFANKPLFETTINKQMDIPTAPAAGEWISRLGNEKCVGKPGEIAPLIIEGKRLYLGRLWAFEQQVFTAIEARLGPVAGLAEERLKTGLNRLFPQDPNHNDIDWQKLASALAVSRRFAVISGGPGTGKTTTVVKVLALLLEQDPGMHIKLAAPTGKAAARMVDSIRNRKADIDIEEGIRALIPEQASTIHRLLGFNGSRFRHDGNHPLVVNCLVVDEASMIDLSLMAHMLDALPVQSRIILLGDRDQLASVEAGSMLGDITGHGQSISYSKEQGRLLEQLTAISTNQLSVNADSPAISDAIALLRTSYRFRGVPDIGKLAEYVNNGEGERALELLRDMNAKQMAWIESEENGISKKALEWAVEQYSQYLQCDNVEDALTHFGQIRILCALHAGPFGISEINRLIAERLWAKGIIGHSEEFHGKPVMVTANDYEVELFNGDVGLLWKNRDGELRAFFKLADNQVRDLPVRNLPEHLPAWALTVHKSQGSEFEQVLLVLPYDENNAILSRELIYTGITRASKKVIIHASPNALIKGCNKRVERSSGLAEKLGWS